MQIYYVLIKNLKIKWQLKHFTLIVSVAKYASTKMKVDKSFLYIGLNVFKILRNIFVKIFWILSEYKCKFSYI